MARRRVNCLDPTGIRFPDRPARSLLNILRQNMHKTEEKSQLSNRRFWQCCNNADMHLGYRDDIMATATFRQIHCPSAYSVFYDIAPRHWVCLWLRFQD